MVSILDAVFTVSPNNVYLGIVRPTTPATHGPVENARLDYIMVVNYDMKHDNSKSETYTNSNGSKLKLYIWNAKYDIYELL